MKEEKGLAGMLRAPEAAAFLGIQIGTLRAWTSKKAIAYSKIGGKVFYDPAELAKKIVRYSPIEAKR
jgi:hypothetical protein